MWVRINDMANANVGLNVRVLDTDGNQYTGWISEYDASGVRVELDGANGYRVAYFGEDEIEVEL